jgi:hypothetical protein
MGAREASRKLKTIEIGRNRRRRHGCRRGKDDE